MTFDDRGLAAVEFAICLPVLLTLLLYGIEMTNYAITRQRVSQLALQIADNASRIGSQEVLRNRPITEAQINDLFVGANLQSGALDASTNGRVILSSLELNPDKGQWIHWQRCFGALSFASRYGKQGDGVSGTGFPGMGPEDARIQAAKNIPVNFVEIGFTYVPIISAQWAPAETIHEIAALAVRDERDLSQIYNSEHEPVATCS